MELSTKQKLIGVAAELLDAGGQEAVTLRAVAERVGVSHNAPYKHFRDRNALLAGVARRDFERLSELFTQAHDTWSDPATVLRKALEAYVDYGIGHPSRYRLLFSDPNLQTDENFKAAALGPFMLIVQMVVRCQDVGALPGGDPVRIGGLIFATAHGAVDLEIGGRSNDKKGLGNIAETLALLFQLIAPDED